MNKFNSLSLSISILISTILFLIIFRLNEIEKIENNKTISEDEIRMANKVYKATRIRDCSNIFKIENDSFNNTKSHHYNSYSDACVIQYKGSDSKVFTKEF